MIFNQQGASLKSNHNLILGIIFLGLVIILLVLVGVFFLPSTQVILQINREPYNQELTLKIDQQYQQSLYQLDTLSAVIMPLDKIDQNKYFLSDQLINQSNSSALVFKRVDLNKLLIKKIQETTLIAKKPINNNNLKIINHQIIDGGLADGRATIKFFIETEVVPVYNLKEIKNFLINRSVAEAITYLRGLPNIREVKLINRPGGAVKLPNLGERIRIRLDII